MGQVTEGAGKKREGQESSEKTPAKSAVPVAFAANFAQATNTDNATPGEETGIADQAVNSLRQEEFSSGIRERRKCDKVKRSAKIGQGPVSVSFPRSFFFSLAAISHRMCVHCTVAGRPARCTVVRA